MRLRGFGPLDLSRSFDNGSGSARHPREPGRVRRARPENGDERTLAAITRADVVKFYESNYGPQTAAIAVAGDFNTAEMERAITEKFGAWKQHGIELCSNKDDQRDHIHPHQQRNGHSY